MGKGLLNKVGLVLISTIIGFGLFCGFILFTLTSGFEVVEEVTEVEIEYVYTGKLTVTTESSVFMLPAIEMENPRELTTRDLYTATYVATSLWADNLVNKMLWDVSQEITLAGRLNALMGENPDLMLFSLTMSIHEHLIEEMGIHFDYPPVHNVDIDISNNHGKEADTLEVSMVLDLIGI